MSSNAWIVSVWQSFCPFVILICWLLQSITKQDVISNFFVSKVCWIEHRRIPSLLSHLHGSPVGFLVLPVAVVWHSHISHLLETEPWTMYTDQGTHKFFWPLEWYSVLIRTTPMIPRFVSPYISYHYLLCVPQTPYHCWVLGYRTVVVYCACRYVIR